MQRREDRKEYWKQHYDLFKNSGLTQREYCTKNDLRYWTFNQWKRRFDKADTNTSVQEIPVKYIPKTTLADRIENIMEDQIKISIPDDFSSVTLQKIFSILREDQ